MAIKEGVDETLKAKDQMAWVQAMNNILSNAEEIVLYTVNNRIRILKEGLG